MTLDPDGITDRTGLDATTYLTVLLVFLYGVSARQVVAPLGAIGTPALLLAGAGGVIWLASRVIPQAQVPTTGPQPLKVALFAYVWYEFAVIVAAHTRPLTALEQSSSARAAITMTAMVGVSLVVMDGIQSLERLDTFLRRLTLAAAFMAFIGLLQFFTGSPFEFRLPGLVYNQDPGTINMRSVFNRPKGTALHAIEFGVVLGALLPLAVHYAVEWPAKGGRKQASVIAAVLVGFAVPLSISRSAIVAVAAALFVLWIGWNRKRRIEGAIVGVIILPVLWLGVPGLLGTFQSMFTSFEQDPSITARVDRIPTIMRLIGERPWFGRGAGTFTMEEGMLLDNQVWGTILSSGVIGLALMLAVIVLAVVMAITSQHHEYATPVTRNLGFAIAAGIVALTVSFATFDALFFKILHTTLFLLIGAAGALWRLTRTPSGGPATGVNTDAENQASSSGDGPGVRVSDHHLPHGRHTRA